MKKCIRYTLLLILGLLVGLIIHGAIEIPAIWLLTNQFSDFFLGISWCSWIKIHLIFSIVIEILGVILVFWIYKKYKK